MDKAISGSCLCGSITITTPHCEKVEACHCGMCRRWTSGAYMALHVDQNLTFNGEEHIQRYRSSEWGERGFCKTCGTHLFYYFVPSKFYVLSAGMFQGPEEKDFTLAEQIYIDNKPDYYGFAQQTPELTEADVIKKFTGQ